MPKGKRVSFDPNKEDFDYGEYIKYIHNSVCDMFLAEAQKAVDYVRNGNTVPLENYQTLRNLLFQIWCFNKPD